MAPARVSTEDVRRRLARIEGQVRGLARMVAEDRGCAEVLQQIKAAQAGLDRVALLLIEEHARGRAFWEAEPSRAERIEELLEATGHLAARG